MDDSLPPLGLESRRIQSKKVKMWTESGGGIPLLQVGGLQSDPSIAPPSRCDPLFGNPILTSRQERLLMLLKDEHDCKSQRNHGVQCACMHILNRFM